ncbi:MAG: hypothetical protein BWY41_00135 [Candidatus Atribacteria bacterium ADurb.Bin276]|uniref:Helix-turn-helix domain protein n=1 Tax=Candidatus Atribacter allofermentans TaxID=1852833 RepID=A0A1V5T3W5_9BACT|nr:MAG: hypothetical protein BWY41_00135 [Candidatus Atribacteria bacterium ADurb.Bin276]
MAEKIEKLHFTLKEAAQLYGISSRHFSERVRNGSITCPVRFFDDIAKPKKRPRMLFPKKKFLQWVEEGTGIVEPDAHKIMKGRG